MGSAAFEAFHAALTLPVQPSLHRNGVYWSLGTLQVISKSFLRDVQRSPLLLYLQADFDH